MKKTKEKEATRPYKFKALKVYTSTEWLADNKKKYRQVYDQTEVSFIYAELSLANKLYDREDWSANIDLKCFHSKKNTLVCHLKYDKVISKSSQDVFIREGWGNKKNGSFWKKGKYYWEAWLDGKKVATKYFFIEEADKKKLDSNTSISSKYANVESIRLYEGTFDDIPEEQRRYLKVFSEADTRYIYTDIELNNNNDRKKWHCELFIKFYNSAKELKGQLVKLIQVENGDESIFITAGWGANQPGSWRKGTYTAEFVLMDDLIAVMNFEVDNHEMLGDAQLLLSGWSNYLLPNSESQVLGFVDWKAKLNALIGLEEIKQQVEEHSLYIKFLRLRRSKGIEDNKPINIHSVFIGNPGTGKTTVANMMGKLYHNMGLLSKGHVHEVDRVDLVGEYIGQTAPKVKEAIENARGGVLFIDEAYSLARKHDDSKDFGKEVIEILVRELSNGPGDLAVIVAGYPDEMKYFLDSNPGLKSRFKHFFDFRDYMPSELMEIALYLAEIEKVVLSSGAKNALNDKIIKAFRDRDRSFGNARFVQDIIEKAKVNMGLRVMKNLDLEKLTKRELQTVLKNDVLNIKGSITRPKLVLPIDEVELKSALRDLHNLIGLDSVKKTVNETVNLVKYHLSQGQDVLNYFNLHTILVGNPGTGKTTVARILARVYKALGIIERGRLIETDRQGLVAGYVGQTAIKANKVVDESLGGVLFIDEAYALAQTRGSQSNDFGAEVIQILIKRMEDQKGEFFLFAAGYPHNMEDFLNSNPGFKSRFDQLLFFEDYSAMELTKIFTTSIKSASYKINKEALNLVNNEIQILLDRKDEFFGNARRIRSMVELIIKKQNLRAAKLDGLNDRKIIPIDIDFSVQSPSEWKAKKNNIGYRSSSKN